MIAQLVLLAVAVSLAAAQAITYSGAAVRSAVSKCFDPQFEAPYGAANVPILTFGMNLFVDHRVFADATLQVFQPAIDLLNEYFKGAKIRFGDVKLFKLTPNAVPPLFDESRLHQDMEKVFLQAHAKEARGRFNLIFAQMPNLTVAGVCLTDLPFFETHKPREPVIFMNLYRSGFFFRWPDLVHETGHAFGLMHTFSKYFGCEVNDIIDDTVLASNDSDGCNAKGFDSCGNAVAQLDSTNIMSYGSCHYGVPLTPGQLRRMRCVFENHMTPGLVPLQQQAAASARPNAKAAPTLTVRDRNGKLLFVPSFEESSSTPSKPLCLGLRGYCDELDAPCESGPRIAKRCQNRAHGCCRDNSAPPVPNLEGLARRCFAVDGICKDSDVDTCDNGYHPNHGFCYGSLGQLKCCTDKPVELSGLGVKCWVVNGTCQDSMTQTCASRYEPASLCYGSTGRVQCCPSTPAPTPPIPAPSPTMAALEPTPMPVEPTPEPKQRRRQLDVAPTNGIVDPLDMTKIIELPEGLTVHVGAELFLKLGFQAKNAVAFLFSTESMIGVSARALDGSSMGQPCESMEDGVVVTLNRDADGATLDRGALVIAIVTRDTRVVDEEQVVFVTTPLYVDVGSCELSSSAKQKSKLSYGLIRSSEVCTRNGGSIVDSKSELASSLICCLPPLIESKFAINRAEWDEIFDSGAGKESPGLVDALLTHELVLKLRKTSFWGAPLVIGIAAPPKENVALYLESSARQQSARAATPVATVTTAAAVGDDGALSASLSVASPGVYHLTDESSQYQSELFSIVPLPCRTRAGAPGYCRPTRAITGEFATTDSSELCTNGDRGPCSQLSVNEIPFACCIGSASALQRRAQYRVTGDNTLENDASTTTILTTTMMIMMMSLVVAILY